MKQFSLLLILILLCTCNKVNIKKEFPEAEGDYQWVYSQSSETDIISAEESEFNYGITIKKNGKLLVFRDKEIINRFKLTSGNYDNNKLYLVSETKKDTFYISIIGDDLTTSAIPNDKYQNHFIKLK